MKLLKFLIFFIIGLYLFIVAIGLIKPTVEYGHEITVNKSVQEAWAVQQDVSKLGQWLQGFKSIDLIEGQTGEVESKYKVVVNPGQGQPDFEMIETIVSLKEFDHISLTFDSEMMEFDQQTLFTEKDGKTTLKTDSKVKGKGFMMRSMFALMEIFTGSFQAQEVKNIEALKKVIEGNTTEYFPNVNAEENKNLNPKE